MIFLNFAIAFLFFILFLCRIKIIKKETSINIINNIKSLFVLKSDKEKIEIYKDLNNSINYKLNFARHYELFLKKIFLNEEENINNYENLENLDENLVNLNLEEIEKELIKIDNPTIRDFNKLFMKLGYEYYKQSKYILVKLGYKIPLMTENDRKKIIEYFNNNKIFFSRLKNGKYPYKNYYDICFETIEQLGIPIDIYIKK